MDRDKALDKIRKCLALAKSSNPHEAATAMRQAQALMREHGVSDLDLSLADVSEARASARSPVLTAWESRLATLVGEAFGCDHFTSVSHVLAHRRVCKRREWIFVGTGTSAEVASYAYEVLARQCTAARTAHIKAQPKACKPITKTARGDQFALGWVYGVQALIQRFAGTERAQALIEMYVSRNYPDMQSARPIDRAVGRNVKDADIHQGIAAGRKARLNRAVDGAPEQGLLA